MTLRYNESTRVYRYEDKDEIPQRTMERACQRLAEWFEPDFATESARNYAEELCKGTGVAVESDRPKNQKGPYWSTNPNEIGLDLQCHDVAAFLRSDWCADLTDLDHKRILAVEWENGIGMRTDTGNGRYLRTWAEFDASPILERQSDENYPEDWNEESVQGSLDKLESAWEEFVDDVSSKVLASIVAEVDYASSESAVLDRLRDCGEGLTEDGRFVDLSECVEGPTEDED